MSSSEKTVQFNVRVPLKALEEMDEIGEILGSTSRAETLRRLIGVGAIIKEEKKQDHELCFVNENDEIVTKVAIA